MSCTQRRREEPSPSTGATGAITGTSCRFVSLKRRAVPGAAIQSAQPRRHSTLIYIAQFRGGTGASTSKSNAIHNIQSREQWFTVSVCRDDNFVLFVSVLVQQQLLKFSAYWCYDFAALSRP